MSKRVLILTQPGDEHTLAVAEALERKGARTALCFTTDFPTRATETARLIGGEIDLRLAGIDLRRVDTVWRRRPAFALDAGALHPADRRFAESQCSAFRHAFYGVLAPHAFWVNPPAAAERSDLKLLQHRAAQQVGFTTPETLYTNDPKAIRQFLRRHSEGVVYKPLRAVTWRDAETLWAPYTSLLTARDLVADPLLQATPGIYQALVPKDYELRVTVMGRRAFAVKLRSQETESGRLDWRRAYGELQMEPYELTPKLDDLCLRLLSALGLVYGCFDFVVTPAGDHIFLEVNEAGQFLFLEYYVDLPLLDAFSELLLQGREDFAWTARADSLRYRDVEAKVNEMAARSMQTHARVPDRSEWEG